MAPVKKAAVAAKPAAKKSAAKADYALEVRSTAVAPIKVFGKVSDTDDGFRIIYKRPRSSKVDTFIIPRDAVYAAEIGDNGWILTDHPDFEPQILITSLNDAEVKNGEIWGTDPKTGNEVFINQSILPSALRHVSYSE